MKLQFLLYLPILFFFLPAFAFYFPGLGIYAFFIFIIYLTLPLLFILDNQKMVKMLYLINKHTPLKYFTIVLLLVAMNGLITALFGIASTGTILKYIVLREVLFILPLLIYFIYVIYKYLTYRRFVKLFIFLYWLTLIIGFVAYIGQLFDITVINNLFDFLANKRIIAHSLGLGRENELSSNYYSYGLPRLDALMEEPAYYASFLYVFMPLCYSCKDNSFKIFKNIYLNKLIKNTIVPFAWLSLILTFSPIYLILTIIITVIYYFKKIKYLVRKYYIFIFSILFIMSFFAIKVDLSDTYISRIINVLINIHSFEDFIVIEPSLATRICSFANTICVFFKHIVTGVGIGNLASSMYYQYQHSPLPLTPEIIERNSILAIKKEAFFNQSYIYAFLAENGVIIFGILVYFYYKIFKHFLVINVHYSRFPNFYTFWTKGLLFTLIALLIGSFYSSSMLGVEYYLIISLMIIFIYLYKKNIRNIRKEKKVYEDIKEN